MGKRQKNNRLRERLGRQQAVGIDEIQFVPCPICLAVFPLCRINDRLEDGEVAMTIEDAPPQQAGYGKSRRCLTCRSCNNRRAFEARAGVMRKTRASAINEVRAHGRPQRGSAEFDELLRVAEITDDEFLVELKAGYIIAYATLGNRYIFDSGRESLRRALLEHSLAPLRPTRGKRSVVCAHLNGEDSTEGRIIEIEGPFAALAVAVPPTHSSRDPKSHSVILPCANSPGNLYTRVDEVQRATMRAVASYPIPPELTLVQEHRYMGVEEEWSVEVDKDILAELAIEHRAWAAKTR